MKGVKKKTIFYFNDLFYNYLLSLGLATERIVRYITIIITKNSLRQYK